MADQQARGASSSSLQRDTHGPSPMRDLLVAHEWVASVGGSENVFRELLATFPEAKAACLWNEAAGTFDRPIAESRLAGTWASRNKALALPLMPWAWRKFDLSDCNGVLASSHAFAHHLATRAAREGLAAWCYVHTPARYVWAPEVEARGRSPLARAGRPGLKFLDRASTHAGVNYAANSHYIRDRIATAWGRESDVIFPPVDVGRIKSRTAWSDHLSEDERRGLEEVPPDSFVLGASRLVDYKRLDRVIEVGSMLGLPVVIAGAGPAEARLRAHAGSASVPVHFVGRVSDAQLFALYQLATLFVFLPIEDFGIMPVEAIASGTPVLVNAMGGAAESVAATGGGVAVEDPDDTTEVAAAAATAMSLDMASPLRLVDQFSKESFRSNVTEWVRA